VRRLTGKTVMLRRSGAAAGLASLSWFVNRACPVPCRARGDRQASHPWLGPQTSFAGELLLPLSKRRDGLAGRPSREAWPGPRSLRGRTAATRTSLDRSETMKGAAEAPSFRHSFRTLVAHLLFACHWPTHYPRLSSSWVGFQNARACLIRLAPLPAYQHAKRVAKGCLEVGSAGRAGDGQGHEGGVVQG
jgi:hypothetical protein